MIIDLREIPVVWINLDKDTENAKKMVDQFERYGFKNHIRFSGLTPDKIVPPVENNWYGFGCGMSHVKILETYKDIPLLILEDDAKITNDFNPILEVPENIDGIYVGTSAGNPYYMTKRYNNDFLRIGNILSTHAVLYLSETFKKNVSDVTKLFVYHYKKPVDIGVASILQHFKVLAPNKPFFVQADDRESNNKWESITARPLEDRNSNFPDEVVSV
jgi:hypothetical protein